MIQTPYKLYKMRPKQPTKEGEPYIELSTWISDQSRQSI